MNLVTIKEIEQQKFADKACIVMNNFHLMRAALRTTLQEFLLARELNHPNILQYKYFMRKHFPKTKLDEFHLIMEFLGGGDLDRFIRKKG